MNQRMFFTFLKNQIKTDTNDALKKKVAKVLDISESGAYKKINAITQLTINEMNNICEYFDLSLGISNKTNDNHPYIFYGDDIADPPQKYEQWAKTIYAHSMFLDRLKPDYKVWSYQSQITYFHLMSFRTLFYFKLFTWNRTSWSINDSDRFTSQSFYRNNELNTNLDAIINHYNTYKTTEVWHVDFLDGLLNQILYFNELGLFYSKIDLEDTIKDLKKLVSHLEQVAKKGKKKIFGKQGEGEKVDIYLNTTHNSSNVIFINAPQYQIMYNLFLHPNYVRSTDDIICNYTRKWIDRLISQSTLISATNEIERTKFFQRLLSKISQLEQSLF